ncbi:glycoside hydrolase family 76 protein, partial [Aulographum hederae CBS 113979]
AIAATKALQQWYNSTTGLWETTGWWNSANCLTILADLTAVDPSAISKVNQDVFQNTFNNAQSNTTHVALNSTTPAANTTTSNDLCVRANCTFTDPIMEPKGFLNGLYDDEGWWALAWIKVWDLTKQSAYLDAATFIFEDMLSTGYNATCGGIWWDRTREHNVAIANELFLSVAAHLANRKPNAAYYRNIAISQWQWFKNSGLINANMTINDGINIKTCESSPDTIWSYNQGVILGALVELNRLDPSGDYISTATRIATAAINTLSVPDGVLHDPHEPNLGVDGPQFKGVFMRNLQVLYSVTNDEAFKQFIEANAKSIWLKNRDEGRDLFGPVWSGPYRADGASAQSAALDGLVAA